MRSINRPKTDGNLESWERKKIFLIAAKRMLFPVYKYLHRNEISGRKFRLDVRAEIGGEKRDDDGGETMTNIVERCTDRLIAVHRDRQRSKRDSTINYA